MARKICIQAGHKGILIGSTGAPGERDWTTKFVPLLATKLIVRGYEVYECDAKATNNTKVISTDWDLFLAVHYDADIYNDRGGFIDTPDQSVDYVSFESSRIAAAMRSVYFSKTGIPEKFSRSNANTKFYYMWRYLSANTPCVLIECGVGNRKPEDHTTLFSKTDLVAAAIVEGINVAFGVQNAPGGSLEALQDEVENLQKLLSDANLEIGAMRKVTLIRDKKLRELADSLDKIIAG